MHKVKQPTPIILSVA